MSHQFDSCARLNTSRKRAFWTTRPEICGNYDLCGVNCAIPGLQYEEVDDPDAGRTINTEDWLTSLILNILNTRARTDLDCPAPLGVYGHWSENYRDDGLYVGSTLWNAAEQRYTSTTQAVSAIRAAIQADMGKLVAVGVANA